MGSTLDIITGGRYELGIGAGWRKREYEAYGYEFPKYSVRISQLKETLQIIKRLWTEPETTFRGKYYLLKNCVNMPKPIQKPHPPIMVGGAGDRLLEVGAENADEINLLVPFGKVQERIRFVHTYCDKIGRNQKELRFSVTQTLVLAKNKNELEALVEKTQPKDQTRQQFLESALVGTAETIQDQIQGYVHLGISRFILIMQDPVPERIKLFSEAVMTHFQ